MSLEQRVARVVSLAAMGLSRDEITYNVGCSSLFVHITLRMAAERR